MPGLKNLIPLANKFVLSFLDLFLRVWQMKLPSEHFVIYFIYYMYADMKLKTKVRIDLKYYTVG